MPDYLNFRDLIDGGGAGQAGPTFQGGGLLSMIANALATPYGSRDRTPVGQPMSALRPMPMPRPQARPAPASYPAGSGMTPANNYVGPPPVQGPPMPMRVPPMQPAVPSLDAAPQVDPVTANFDAFLRRSFSPQQISAIRQSPEVMQSLYRDWISGGMM